MKRIMFCVAVMAAASALAGDPKIGDTREQVTDDLGRPKGAVSVGKNEVLMYERGSIELTDGKVTLVKFVTPEALAARQSVEEAQAKEAAESRAKLVEAAKAEKEKMLADPEFAKKTPADQIAYWQDFARRFPGIDVSAQAKDATQLQQAVEKIKQETAVASKPPPREMPKMSSHKLRRFSRTAESDNYQRMDPLPEEETLPEPKAGSFGF